MKFAFALLSLLGYLHSAQLFAAPTPLLIEAESLIDNVDLLPLITYGVDPTNKRDPDSLKIWGSAFKPLNGLGIFMYNKDTYWIRFEVDNRSKNTRNLTLVPVQSFMDLIELYEWIDEKPNLLVTKGDGVADPYPENRFPTLALHITPGLHTYYVRMRNVGPMFLKFNAWDSEVLARHIRKDFLLVGFLFGFLAVMVAYNTFLAIRLRIVYYFYYVAYIICFGMTQFIFSGMARYLLPDQIFSPFIYNQWLILSAEFTGVFSCLFAIPFLKLRQSSPRMVKVIFAAMILSITNMIISFFNFTFSSSFALFTGSVYSAILIYAGVSGCVRRYRPAYFYTASWVFLLSGSSLTQASIFGFVPHNSFTAWSMFVGGAIEVVLLSLALGDKLSLEQENSHKAISQLNLDLNSANGRLREHIENVELIVEEKTRDIRSIMEHIPLGILMIGSDRKVHKDHSRYIENLFASSKLESIQATELIFTGSNLSSDKKSQVDSCIIAAMGENLVNFEINSHILPTEFHRMMKGEQPQIFELTWNPIENASRVVNRILVTLRDVTKIRALQEQSRNQREELEFIGEILNVPAPRFLRFINLCHDLLAENAKLIESQGLKKRNYEILKLLFINMHTIKGVARSFYFKKMAHIFHDIEQYYALLQQNPAVAWDAEKMSQELQQAKNIVHLYQRLALEKLGRSQNQTHAIEFHRDQVAFIYRTLSVMLRSKNVAENVRGTLGDVQALFFHKLFKDARDVFEELSGCLPLLAKDLQKEIPDLELKTNGILVSERGEEIFRNIFVHIFRNSMDHGIESPHIRKEQGKNPKGCLRIKLERQDHSLVLCYTDDGCGLALSKIGAIGLARNLITLEQANDPLAVANLIFDSGLSTANELTEISGRGVGMSAVLRFIQEGGGRIEIVLDQRNADPIGKACPFYLHIQLPFALFEQSHEFDDQSENSSSLMDWSA